MVLAFDAKGALVQDLKAEEFKVVDSGEAVKVQKLQGPAVTSQEPGQWVFLFEPVRDPNHRLAAVRAAAEFLDTFAAGDKALIIVRSKEAFTCLTPGLTAQRTRWAAARNQLPDLHLENLTNALEPSKALAGFTPGFQDGPLPAGDATALAPVLNDLRQGAPRFLTGTRDVRGSTAMQRLNFDNAPTVASRVRVVLGEMASLGEVFKALEPLAGPKQVVIFSRFDADDTTSPEILTASTKYSGAPGAKRMVAGGGGSSTFNQFTRSVDDQGGPAEYASLLVRDTTLARERLQTLIAHTGITLHSVAGNGPAWMGNLGRVALNTGGYAFPLTPATPAQLPAVLQFFNARYELTWLGPVPAPGVPLKLEISTTRKGIKIMAPTLR